DIDNANNKSGITVKASPAISAFSFESAGGVLGLPSFPTRRSSDLGYNPSGTVTFTLTAPNGTTSPIGSVAINGDGTYSLPTTVSASQLTTYIWHASYAGDGFNNGEIDDGANESLITIKASPSLSTS